MCRRDFAADWLHTHMSEAAQAQAEENGFLHSYGRNHNTTFRMVWWAQSLFLCKVSFLT